MLLKKLLKTKDEKQKRIACKLIVSELTMNNRVKEKSKPNQKNPEKISEILNITKKKLIN